MKSKLIFAGLFLAIASSVTAATETPNVALRADSIVQEGSLTIGKGSAVAEVGTLKVFSEQITFDRETGILKCVGETTVRLPGGTLKAVDPTIATKEKDVSVRATEIRAER